MPAVNEEVIKCFKDISSGYKKDKPLSMVLKLNEDFSACEIESLQDQHSTFDDMISALPENEPRYVVANIQFQAEDGRKISKIVFVHYRTHCEDAKMKFAYANSSGDVKAKCAPAVSMAVDREDMNFDTFVNKFA